MLAAMISGSYTILPIYFESPNFRDTTSVPFHFTNRYGTCVNAVTAEQAFMTDIPSFPVLQGDNGIRGADFLALSALDTLFFIDSQGIAGFPRADTQNCSQRTQIAVPENFLEQQGKQNGKDCYVQKQIQFQSESHIENHGSDKQNQNTYTNSPVAQEFRRLYPCNPQFTVYPVDSPECRVHRTDPTAVKSPKCEGQYNGNTEYREP
jgi:hypothetical protein